MAGLGGAGAGSDAGAVRAGNAFVQLGVKDTTGPDLKKAEERFKQFGETARKAIGGQVNQLGEQAGKTGATGLGLAGAITSLAALGRNADAFLAPLRDTNRELALLSGAAATALTGLDALNDGFERARENAERLGTGNSLAILDKQIGVNQDRQRRLVDQLKAIRAKQNEILNLDKPSDLFALFKGASEQLDQAAEDVLSKSGELQKTIDELRKRRLNPSITDTRGDALRQGIFDVAQEINTALDDQVAAAGAFERKVLDLIRAAGQLNEAEQEVLKTQQEQARAADERIKQREIDKAFIDELKSATLTFETQGLSAADARLANLVARGFSNEQIMALRGIGARMKQAGAGGSSSAGGFAGDLDSRSLGIASSWQRDVKSELELSNEILDGLRTDLAAIDKKLTMK